MELLIIRHALPVAVDNTATGEEADPELSDLGTPDLSQDKGKM